MLENAAPGTKIVVTQHGSCHILEVEKLTKTLAVTRGGWRFRIKDGAGMKPNTGAAAKIATDNDIAQVEEEAKAESLRLDIRAAKLSDLDYNALLKVRAVLVRLGAIQKAKSGRKAAK